MVCVGVTGGNTGYHTDCDIISSFLKWISQNHCQLCSSKRYMHFLPLSRRIQRSYTFFEPKQRFINLSPFQSSILVIRFNVLRSFWSCQINNQQSTNLILRLISNLYLADCMGSWACVICLCGLGSSNWIAIFNCLVKFIFICTVAFFKSSDLDFTVLVFKYLQLSLVIQQIKSLAEIDLKER